MRFLLQLLLFLFSVLSLISFPSLIHAKSVIEPCSSSDSCTSLLAYVLPWDSKISEIANRFQVNLTALLAANSINPSIPSLGNKIRRANSFVKIPIACPCVDGIRRSLSTTYKVQAADSVESIAEGYGGLVSAVQITTMNMINATNPLWSKQSLVIHLPCTCFNNSNNGVATVYMSYVVQRGDRLSSIGVEFGTTVTDLEAINGLGQPIVYPGDILAVPISDQSQLTIDAACSSANLNWHNESLIVPNGSYALTANNCIKCTCGTDDLNLQCFPSGMAVPCSHLQCAGSNIFIGDAHVKQMAAGCNVSTCVYRGHSGRKIFRSLVNSSKCPAKQDNGKASPMGSSWPPSPVVPLVTLSPSPSPFLGANTNIGNVGASGPKSKQNSNISDTGGLDGQISCYSLWLTSLVIHYLM